MKRIEYVSIKAENFQGLKQFSVQLDGKDATITAPNGVGKTTIANMPHWLFFGCDSLGKAENDLCKPLDEDMKPIHNLDTVVEIVLRIDGKPRRFKRLFKEKWVTKKGAAIAEFTGHTNEYWIDGVPYDTEREFQAECGRIVDLIFWPMMTNPAWFMSDKLKTSSKSAEARRREILLSICGDVGEDDVIRANPELKALSARGERSVAEWLKIQKASLSESEKERDSIPRLINECRLNRSEVVPGDHEVVLAERQAVAVALREKKAQAQAGGYVATLSVDLQRAEGRILERRQSLTQVSNPARPQALADRREVQERVDTAMQARRGAVRKMEDIETDLRRIQSEIGTKLPRAQAIAAQIKAIDDEKFTGETVCPGCGQELPQDRIQAAIEKHNTRAAEQKGRLQGDLAAIVAEGKALRACEQAIIGKDETVGTLTLAKADVADIDAEITRLQTDIAAIVVPDVTVAAPESDSEYKRLVSDRDAVAAELRRAREDSESIVAEIAEELRKAESAVTETQGVIAQIKANGGIDERIRKHEARQKELGGILEEQARMIYLCEQFVQAHVALSEDRINSRFLHIRWKLFDVQINGGIASCCIPTIGGSSNLSNGEKILAGLDICRFFQNAHGILTPIWIDNSESFTKEIPLDCQVIRLRALRGAPSRLDIQIEGSPADTPTSAASRELAGAAPSLF